MLNKENICYKPKIAWKAMKSLGPTKREFKFSTFVGELHGVAREFDQRAGQK